MGNLIKVSSMVVAILLTTSLVGRDNNYIENPSFNTEILRFSNTLDSLRVESDKKFDKLEKIFSQYELVPKREIKQ